MLSEMYIKNIVQKLEGLSSASDAIKSAAELCGSAALNGSNIFIHDKTGIIDNEVTERASGLALIQKLSGYHEAVKAGDVIILSSLFSGDADDLTLAETLKNNGTKLIIISPKGSLADMADIAIVYSGEDGNGVVEIAGLEKSICPVNGIINAALAWSLAAEIAVYIMNADKVPTVFCGRYLKDGVEKYQKAQRDFTAKGY